jgi:hypothetical protein
MAASKQDYSIGEVASASERKSNPVTKQAQHVVALAWLMSSNYSTSAEGYWSLRREREKVVLLICHATAC